MAITDWKVGQRVVMYDSSRSSSPKTWNALVAKVGRKLVTTADGHTFDTAFSPPQENTGYGSSPRLYSLEKWEERTWRCAIQAKLLRMFERDYEAATVPLGTMMSLSAALSIEVPEHLKPKMEERIDEIRNVDSTDDHHHASSAK